MVSKSGTVIAPEEADPTLDLPETFIRPREGWEPLQLSDLWKFRHLIYFLTWRDLKVRYKQTALGALWAILQPALMMVVFGQVFGGIAGISSPEMPYSIFLYAGLLPWTFVSQATSKAAMSVASSERLVEKVYFPRLVIPISSVAGAFVDFAIAFVVLILMMFWFRITPKVEILLLPVAIVLLWLVSLGIGILYASVNITYRDFRHLIGFLIQIWMFTTPSIYDPDAIVTSQPEPQVVAQAEAQNTPDAGKTNSSADKKPAAKQPVPKKLTQRQMDEAASREKARAWVSVLDLNPLTAIIAFFRATVLGGPIPWFMLAKSTILSLIILFIGLMYFRRTEDKFADII